MYGGVGEEYKFEEDLNGAYLKRCISQLFKLRKSGILQKRFFLFYFPPPQFLATYFVQDCILASNQGALWNGCQGHIGGGACGPQASRGTKAVPEKGKEFERKMRKRKG